MLRLHVSDSVRFFRPIIRAPREATEVTLQCEVCTVHVPVQVELTGEVLLALRTLVIGIGRFGREFSHDEGGWDQRLLLELTVCKERKGRSRLRRVGQSSAGALHLYGADPLKANHSRGSPEGPARTTHRDNGVRSLALPSEEKDVGGPPDCPKRDRQEQHIVSAGCFRSSLA